MADPAISYRAFIQADAASVQQVALDAWKSAYASLYDLDFIETFVRVNYAPERLAAIAPDVLSGSTFFHLALHQSQVIGFCHIGNSLQGAFLYRLYLLPAYIGLGIGRELLRRGEAFVRAQGYDGYGCYVHQANEVGKRFYFRQGFVHQAERDHEEEWYLEKCLREGTPERPTA